MPRLVAVDLGSHAVKVTVFRTSGRRYVLDARLSQPVATDGEGAPGIGARLDALDMLLSQHREWTNPANTVSVAWPSGNASLHRITLPFTDRNQVQKTLRFAVEDEVPFDIENYAMGWRTVSAIGETVLMVGLVARSQLGYLIGEFSARKIDPQNVYCDADLNGCYGDKNRVVAVVDVGHASTQVTVAQDGAAAFVHSIDVAGMAFTQEIQRSLGCSWAEAERIKHGEAASPGGLPPRLSAEVRQALDGSMGLLLAEIRSSLINAEDALGLEVDEIRLTGGGARLSPLSDYIHQDLGVPVVGPVDPEGEPIPGPHAVSQALAMSMHRLTSGKEIDLRVDEFAYRGGVDVLKATLTYGTALALVFAITLVGVFGYQNVTHNREAKALEAQIKELVVEIIPSAEATATNTMMAKSVLEGELIKARERGDLLGDENDEPPTVATLLEITNAMPSPGTPPAGVTLDVSTLTITQSSITFTAETDGYKSVDDIEASLLKNERYTTVEKSAEKKGSKVRFSMTISWEGDEDEEAG